jgi:lipopolysaccharide biosynthesis glycosyltransferase
MNTQTGDTIHVAFGFDEQMELPFLFAANSIKRRSKQGSRKIVIHALHSDPLKYSATYLSHVDSEAFTICFYPIQNRLDGIRIKGNNSAAAYLRLQLPEVLADIKRVVYLDCDIAVLKDIAELYDSNLHGFPLGAVLDYSMVYAFPFNNWRIGYEPHTWSVQEYMRSVVRLTDWRSYFNSGIFVADLDRLRQENVRAKCEEFIRRTDTLRIWNDQDALNHVVDGCYARLDPRWNVTAAGSKESDLRGCGHDLAAVANLRRTDPWIVHYCGRKKPWSANTERTFWDHYFWHEAIECPLLPQLLESYLIDCERQGLTYLHSPASLLAVGKPRLDRYLVTTYFEQVVANSAATRALVGRLHNQWAANRKLAIPSTRFGYRSGIFDGEILNLNLAGASETLVYGPYVWYPPGDYKVLFDFSITGHRRAGSKVVIEVVSDADHFLAQRELSESEKFDENTRTLTFTLDGSELYVEFRIFASGFVDGVLSFRGTKLSSMRNRDEAGVLAVR